MKVAEPQSYWDKHVFICALLTDCDWTRSGRIIGKASLTQDLKHVIMLCNLLFVCYELRFHGNTLGIFKWGISKKTPWNLGLPILFLEARRAQPHLLGSFWGVFSSCAMMLDQGQDRLSSVHKWLFTLLQGSAIRHPTHKRVRYHTEFLFSHTDVLNLEWAHSNQPGWHEWTCFHLQGCKLLFVVIKLDSDGSLTPDPWPWSCFIQWAGDHCCYSLACSWSISCFPRVMLELQTSIRSAR